MNFLIRYKKPNLFRIGSMRFMPGVQEISEAQWDEIKNHPLLPFRFENGDLEWIDGKGPEDFTVDKEQKSEIKGEIENPLLACSAKKARQIVLETYNLDNLSKWADQEQRASVKKEIISQIEKLESNTTEKENKDLNKPNYS